MAHIAKLRPLQARINTHFTHLNRYILLKISGERFEDMPPDILSGGKIPVWLFWNGSPTSFLRSWLVVELSEQMAKTEGGNLRMKGSG